MTAAPTPNTYTPELDYRLGWRWLVQPSPDDGVFIDGFPEEEWGFLRHVWDDRCKLVKAADDASIWVFGENIKSIPKSGADLRQVCLLGNKKLPDHWKVFFQSQFQGTIQPYALLPAYRPRIVVPIGPKQATKVGLDLYSPGRSYAKMAVKFSKACAHFRFYPILKNRQLWIADKKKDADSQIYTLYLGNPEHNRKTVILPSDKNGAKGSLIKYGETPEARAALKNEADALQKLAETNLKSQVPKLLDFKDEPSGIAMEQEFRQRISCAPEQLHKSALDFLRKLSCEGREMRSLSSVLESIESAFTKEQLTEQQSEIIEQLRLEAYKGKNIIGHRSHGDFTSWNCAMTKKGFFVFDWEMSEAWSPALTDFFYFSLAPKLLIQSTSHSISTHKEKLLSEGADFLSALGEDPQNIEIYWQLSLISINCRLNLPPLTTEVLFN